MSAERGKQDTQIILQGESVKDRNGIVQRKNASGVESQGNEAATYRMPIPTVLPMHNVPCIAAVAGA